MGQNYYEILGVSRRASAAEIRKAYLKLSLMHHPDKNMDNPEAAKSKFIEIGSAYETLRDEQTRACYDNDLRSGGGGFGFNRNQQQYQQQHQQNYGAPPQNNFWTPNERGGGSGPGMSGGTGSYDAYRDIFDSTVAGMSEAELSAAIGTATIIGGFIGSLLGKKLAKNMGGDGARSAGGAGSSALATAGSMMGGMVASEMAASSVKALHQQSRERLQYKEDCRRAVERGESMPTPPITNGKFESIFQNAIQMISNMADTTDGSTTNGRPSRGAHNEDPRSGASTADTMSTLWKVAQAGMKMAAESSKNNSGTSNAYR